MAVKEVLLLGNPQLYKVSLPVKREEIDEMRSVVTDLHDTLMAFHKRYGAGRAIAAPQIGVMKRLLYMCINNVSTIFINPELEEKSSEMMAVWDDCLCFPDLLVKVYRHKSCRIRYLDMDGKEESEMFNGDLSELLQHEYDHLEGTLAVSRAIDKKAFALRTQRSLLGSTTIG